MTTEENTQEAEPSIAKEIYHAVPGTRLTTCVLELSNGISVSGQADFIRPPEQAQAAAKQDALRRLAEFGWRSPIVVPPAPPSESGARAVALDEVARVAHEVNRAYCQAIGDESQPTWEQAPEWQRESAINGVRFHLAHRDATPAASHENWMHAKLADGWAYGPVKNAEAKTHPCLVPFVDLPIEQQVKDYLFRAVVHNLVPL